jgi:hypothetical protein
VLLLGCVTGPEGAYPGVVFEGMAELLTGTEAYPLERLTLEPGDEAG